MSYMSNQDIKIKIVASGLMKWQIADAINIADTTFSKWLRKPLSEEREKLVLDAIEKLTQRVC
jgi:hypothetical protein